MRGLRIVDVAPGPSGAMAVRRALHDRLSGGPAIALAPTPSRHMSEGYVSSVRAALVACPPEVDDDVAVVLATSGSTGRPRAVRLTESNLRAAATAAATACPGLDERDWVLAVPATSVGGLNVIARAVLFDRDLTFLASVGGAVPFDPAELVERHLSQSPVVSLVPGQLRSVLENPDATKALAGAHTVLVGGAALRESLRTRAREAGIRAVSTYGMTETTGGCVFDGVPLPGVTIDIDERGHITVTGDLVALGYADGGPSDGFTADGSFTTADLGVWESGRLRVVGRADDIVTVHGVNVGLSAIEGCLTDLPAVAQAAAIAIPDDETGHRLIAFVVADNDVATDDLAEHIADALGRAARPAIARVDSLPHLPNGKIDRLALRRQAEADRPGQSKG